jgi:hypothetical protein
MLRSQAECHLGGGGGGGGVFVVSAQSGSLLPGVQSVVVRPGRAEAQVTLNRTIRMMVSFVSRDMILSFKLAVAGYRLNK